MINNFMSIFGNKIEILKLKRCKNNLKSLF